MDGIHDLGGMEGFGRVVEQPDEPAFHSPWEGRVLAINRAMSYAGAWNIDMSRYARERIAPALYLTSSYYERWEWAMELSIVERGIATEDELATGRSLHDNAPPARRLSLDDLEAAFRRGEYARPAPSPARFSVGATVLARNVHPSSHTRLPRYARGHVGRIERIQGCCVFPDSSAFGLDEDPQWLYTVQFDGRELWGGDSDPAVTVSIDAFEPYLEVA